MQHDSGVLTSTDALEAVRRGVRTLADVVGTTLGPLGRNVVIVRDGAPPRVTKDGVTVARAVSLSDPFEAAAVELVRQVALTVNDAVGDGTTTATVLTSAIVDEAARAVLAGLPSRGVCEGVAEAAAAVLEELDGCVLDDPPEDVVGMVATISANGDVVVGEAVARAVTELGPDGVVSVEDARGFETTTTVVDGVRWAAGYVSPYFVTDVVGRRAQGEDALVLVSLGTLTSLDVVVPALARARESDRSLLVFAPGVGDEVLRVLTTNVVQGRVRVCVVGCPRGGHASALLDDLALVTGARPIPPGATEPCDPGADLGSTRSFEVTRTSTSLVEPGGDPSARAEREAELRGALADVNPVDARSQAHHEELLARLGVVAGRAAVVRVGGGTDVDVGERRDRVVDALHAAQSAARSGVVVGGGCALYHAARRAARRLAQVDDLARSEGRRVLLEACAAVVSRILTNAGHRAERALASLDAADVPEGPPRLGVDVASGGVTDLVAAGVVDPADAPRTALSLAVDVATVVVATGAVVVDRGGD